MKLPEINTTIAMQNVEYTNPIQLKLSVALSSFNFISFLVMSGLVVFCKKRLPGNEFIKIF